MYRTRRCPVRTAQSNMAASRTRFWARCIGLPSIAARCGSTAAQCTTRSWQRRPNLKCSSASSSGSGAPGLVRTSQRTTPQPRRSSSAAKFLPRNPALPVTSARLTVTSPWPPDLHAEDDLEPADDGVLQDPVPAGLDQGGVPGAVPCPGVARVVPARVLVVGAGRDHEPGVLPDPPDRFAGVGEVLEHLGDDGDIAEANGLREDVRGSGGAAAERVGELGVDAAFLPSGLVRGREVV